MPGAVGRVTASGQLVTGSGVIYGIGIVGAGGLATVTLYDGTTDSGAVLWELETLAEESPQLGGMSIAYSKGIYVRIAGAGSPSVTVNYG